MNLKDLFDQVPANQHHEIVTDGGHVWYAGKEYVNLDGRLHLVNDLKRIEDKLDTLAETEVVPK
jgi:hypothetical protein